MIFVVVLCLFLSSCYVRHPRFSSIDEVLLIKPGMTQTEVDSIMQTTGPYDIETMSITGEVTYIYKYRVSDIKRLPLLMKRNKGLKTDGRLKDMLITYGPEGIVHHIETREEPEKSITEKKKIDPNTVIQAITTAITVTIPALLFYVGATQ